MSRDYFSVGYDGDFMSDPAEVYIPINTPENKRDIPCSVCSQVDKCARDGKECVAARVWYQTGDYAKRDMARLLR